MSEETRLDQQSGKTSFRPSSSHIFIAVSLVVLAVFLGLAFMFLNSSHPNGPNQAALNGPDSNGSDQNIAATVNGQKILLSTVEKRFKSVPSELAGQITKTQILDNLIESTLILQEAEKKGIAADDNEVQSLFSQSQDQLNQVMAESGMTKEDILQTIKEYLITQKFLDEVIYLDVNVSPEETAVTPQEISDFFEQNKDQIKEVQASHILVEDENKANGLLAQLKAGADFAQLAKDNSIDTGSAQNGGDLGFFPKGMMVKEFEDAAFALQPGQLSEVVKTQFGYHIILLKGIKDNLESFSPQIEQYLSSQKQQQVLGQKQQQAYTDYVQNLKQGAKIDIYYKEQA